MWGSQETTQNPDRKTASESLAGISESQKTRNQNKNTCQQQKRVSVCQSYHPPREPTINCPSWRSSSRAHRSTRSRAGACWLCGGQSGPPCSPTSLRPPAMPPMGQPLRCWWVGVEGENLKKPKKQVFNPWSPYLTTFWRLYVPEILQVQGPVEIHMEPLMSCLRWNMPLSSQRTWAIHLV